MNIRLKKIENWTELAYQSEWSVSRLARLCGVSEDTLLRYFLDRMNMTTRAWLMLARQKEALHLLRKSVLVKEVAANLGYAQQTNFTRRFKEHWGIVPRSNRLTRLRE